MSGTLKLPGIHALATEPGSDGHRMDLAPLILNAEFQNMYSGADQMSLEETLSLTSEYYRKLCQRCSQIYANARPMARAPVVMSAGYITDIFYKDPPITHGLGCRGDEGWQSKSGYFQMRGIRIEATYPNPDEIRLISHGDKYEAARLVIPRDKLDEVISALAAIILPSDKLAELAELVGALGKVRSSIYERNVQSGEMKPKEWYLHMYNPEERARSISRQHFAMAEYLEKRSPEASRAIATIHKAAERLRDDPERLISGAVAHLREKGELYAALADDDYAAEINASDNERHYQYKIERSWRVWLELYNMRDGWNFRLALRERVLGWALGLLRRASEGRSEWKEGHLALEYAGRLDEEHTALTGARRPVSFRFAADIGWFPETGWYPY
jgi:hypothetical protein